MPFGFVGPRFPLSLLVPPTKGNGVLDVPSHVDVRWRGNGCGMPRRCEDNIPSERNQPNDGDRQILPGHRPSRRSEERPAKDGLPEKSRKTWNPNSSVETNDVKIETGGSTVLRILRGRRTISSIRMDRTNEGVRERYCKHVDVSTKESLPCFFDRSNARLGRETSMPRAHQLHVDLRLHGRRSRRSCRQTITGHTAQCRSNIYR